MDSKILNHSDVSELVELPDSESGRFGGSSPSIRVNKEWECVCCKQIFKTRKLLCQHKHDSLKCSLYAKKIGHEKTNKALTGRKYPGRKLSEEHKQKLRESAKNRASYWFYNNKNPILYTRKEDGKEIKLDSKWELEVVKRLDNLNIKWYRPKISFDYQTIDGKMCSYHPDFFIPEYRCFLEIKSPWVEQLQNVNGKIDYIKNNYPFIIWLESLEDCKTFILQDKQFGIIPLEEEENQEIISKIKAQLEAKKIKTKRTYRSPKSFQLEQQRRDLLNKCLKEKSIDFSKHGWVNEVAQLFGISPNKVNIYIKKRLPDLYEKFFHRKS